MNKSVYDFYLGMCGHGRLVILLDYPEFKMYLNQLPYHDQSGSKV